MNPAAAALILGRLAMLALGRVAGQIGAGLRMPGLAAQKSIK